MKSTIFAFARYLDRAGLSVRDLVILNYVLQAPGSCGTDICKALGYPNRSSAVSNFNRLIREGYMVDRREREIQAVPSRYFATDKGKALWEELSNGVVDL